MSMQHLMNSLAPATQAEQADPRQVQNNAGGYTFQVDDWERLRRFLILGSEGGTYYASEQKLTRENAKVVERLALSDGARLVAEVVAISDSGRAPKNDPAILSLAIAARLGNAETKAAAFAALPKVCRIGTHLYHFVAFADQLGGWGRALRTGVSKWFNDKSVDDLAYQLIKYQQRDGWSARDLLRLSHAKPRTDEHAAMFKWATSSFDDAGAEGKSELLPPIVHAFEELKKFDVKDATALARVTKLIVDSKLPREAIPTQWLNKAEVWEALLPHMGLTALIRNLAKMTSAGVIAPLGQHVPGICARIQDADQLRRGRVHPIQLLSALKTYGQGHGEKGSSTWTPVQQIVDALDAGFYAAFAAIEPTNKPTLLAIDVSGSMDGNPVAGIHGLTSREAAGVMAMVTARSESNYHTVGFSGGLRDLPISPRMRLEEVTNVMARLPFDRTDCALPFYWAAKGGYAVHSFAVYTDNETWHGRVHPHVALEQYRQGSGIAARSAVVAFTASPFTIANPSDPGMMDFIGFDAAAPAVMADFFRGPGTGSRGRA